MDYESAFDILNKWLKGPIIYSDGEDQDTTFYTENDSQEVSVYRRSYINELKKDKRRRLVEGSIKRQIRRMHLDDLSVAVIHNLTKAIYLIKLFNNDASINYPIIMTLLLQSEDIRERIKPFLPKNKNSWKKNEEMFAVYERTILWREGEDASCL